MHGGLSCPINKFMFNVRLKHMKESVHPVFVPGLLVSLWWIWLLVWFLCHWCAVVLHFVFHI